MADEWRTLTVDEIKAPDDRAIAIGPFGSRMKAGAYVPGGVPIIRGSNISDTRGFIGDFVFVSNETADELQACNVFSGDLVFPHRGAIGRVGVVPEDGTRRYMLSTSLMKLTCNSQIVERLFVFYYFRSALGRNALLERASTVGTPGIGQPLSSLRSIRVPIPPLPEQRAIAHILGTLDDKIELNRRMNETLEAMARALFKSWFVDFDPVRAKAEGRDPGLPEHIADLFPARLIDSELGEIPEGWDVKAVGDLEDVVGGSTPSTKESRFWDGGTIHWTTPKDLSSLSTPVLLDTERKITEEGLGKISSGLLPAGTLLLSSRAPVGYLAIAQVPVAVNQGYIAIPPGGRMSPAWMLFWCEASIERIKARAGGTTFQEISKRNFRSLLLVAPSSELARHFDDAVKPVLNRIVSNERETRALAALRDTLLPKLISGQIRVGPAQNRECERVQA